MTAAVAVAVDTVRAMELLEHTGVNLERFQRHKRGNMVQFTHGIHDSEGEVLPTLNVIECAGTIVDVVDGGGWWWSIAYKFFEGAGQTEEDTSP
ncbi:hypothetical protein WG66_016935 [Moniliophthora roreri]|nr:hypothetical protein WG66_016935 [Moniliophthora roreri]